MLLPQDSSPQMLPMDEHNQELIANVHPGDWRNPKPAEMYNLVVIGGGTAGLVTAAGAAGLGARVALIEKNLLGGDCLNLGCVPSKALIRSARALAGVREAGRFGVRVPEGCEVDFPSVMRRMRRLRAGISHHDSAERFRGLGVDVFLGSASFLSGDRIQVADSLLRCKKAVIASGARSAPPPIPGLQAAGYLTNESVFSLTRLPPRLAVIGAGPVGCELAQTFQRFGSRVTLLEVLPRILPREDAQAADIVKQSLLREGVEILLEAELQEVAAQQAEKVLHLRRGVQFDQLAVDEILVSAGRIPNLEGLNLEQAGVDYDPRKGILVNDRLQSSNPSIYAAGDVCSPYQFTHVADAMARIVIQNALFLGRKKASALVIPWCIFTDPEVAHVGLREEEAESQGIAVDLFQRNFKDVDRAIVDGETEGYARVLTRQGSDEILGGTIVAGHAGDMISELSLAMVAGIGLGTIASTIHPYPTQAEAIKQLGDAYNRTRLTPTVSALFKTWLSWCR